MKYNYPVRPQRISQKIGDIDSCVLRFGDDWPGIFISSKYASDFCKKLNNYYLKKDFKLVEELVNSFHELLEKSHIENLDENIIKLEEVPVRIETGHVIFNDDKSGYFFRGDHSFAMKSALNSPFIRNKSESYSHIPFLINESNYWSKI